MSLDLCKECGEFHDNPKEHLFTYVEPNDILNKRGLIDSITLEPFIDPVELNCGHTFSQYSIENVFLTKKECPECRKKVSKFHQTSRIVREQVNQLEVWCPNKCKAHVERQFLPNHLTQQCPITKIFCHNKYNEEQCKFYGIRDELDKHENECKFRILACEGKCGVVSFEEPNHNCIHYLSKQSKQMIELINKMHPELQQIKKHLREQDKTLTIHKSYIQEKDTKMKEKDTIISFLEKKSIIQDQKLHKLTEEIHVINKEAYDNKFKLLKENAVKGDIMTQIQVGKIFENGNKYVMKNIELAQLWYGKAKAQDSKMAMNYMKSLENEPESTPSQKRAFYLLEPSNSHGTDNQFDTLGDNPSTSTSKKLKTDFGVVFGKSGWENKSSESSKPNDDTK